MIFTTRLPVLFHDTLVTGASKRDNQNSGARLRSVTALKECEVGDGGSRICVIKQFDAGLNHLSVGVFTKFQGQDLNHSGCVNCSTGGCLEYQKGLKTACNVIVSSEATVLEVLANAHHLAITQKYPRNSPL